MCYQNNIIVFFVVIVAFKLTYELLNITLKFTVLLLV